MLDLIIPASELLPSAGHLDSKEFIEKEMQGNLDIKNAVIIVIDLAHSRSTQEFEKPFLDCDIEQQIEILSLIETAHKDLFNIFVTLIYSFFYTHEKVLALFKTGAVPPQPKGYPMEMGCMELRKKVQARGPLYRDC
jgi:hypothetical protein